MKKIKVKMNKPVYLGLSILEIIKTLMYEFWYNYLKPKYQHSVKLCHMHTDSFIINIKTGSIYEKIVNDVKKRSDTSIDYYLHVNIKKLMQDKLGGKIMTEFAGVCPKTYSCLLDDGNSDKKAKGT